MPKVLRIINRFNLGGPTYNVCYLTKYLSPDFETLLIGGRKEHSEGDSVFIAESLGLEPLILNDLKRSINLFNDIRAYRKIKSIIREFKPDIVHTHASKSGTLGRLAALQSGVPVIIHTFHGHVFDAYFSKISTSFFKLTERWLAEKSNCIIALSEAQKDDIAYKHNICHPDKIRIIPLGFDLSRFQRDQNQKRISFRTKYMLDDDEIAIGIIGRLAPIKNHLFFIDAIKKLSEKTEKKIRAFVIGDGEEKENITNYLLKKELDFTDFTRENKISLFTLTSWIREIDMALAGLDIVGLCSLNEGTPVSLIEAQAAGKAIAATRVGGIENVVIPGETALLSPDNDIDAFVNNLLKLSDNSELRTKISKKGWQHVKEKYHYTRLVEETRMLYNELLKNY